MFSDREVLSTLAMVRGENLDLRTVTLGVSLFDCCASDPERFQENIFRKITRLAAQLVPICNEAEEKYGVPIVNKRLSVSPIAAVGAAFDATQMVRIAQTLDAAAHEVGVDFVGGFGALVEKGCTPGDRHLIEALPEALATTERLCASINVATTRAGINMDAVALMGETIKATANRTADRDGLGCAKLVVFANIPQDVPFMAGAYLGIGEPDAVINVGVSGPGVVNEAIRRARSANSAIRLDELAELVKRTACRVTRVGELIGREVAAHMNIRFGIVDLSLAPTPRVGDSVGEIFRSLGLSRIGAPGSTAALAMLNDAVKRGGAFASCNVGGLSGAFIPVSEDLEISAAAEDGTLSLEKLEAMTSVCSVGLDMIALPGDTDATTISGIIADEMAIGVINKKSTAARLIPVPGKKAGERASFGGLLGSAIIMPVKSGSCADFIRQGGLIPAPLQSLIN
ncbi:MAG: PFL family protein [Deltaproteobacteria bacterium]|nr:PFL family protein [Deltaproteobacteria bacterium]